MASVRILLVTPAFPRHETDATGAEYWRVAEALSDRGHSVKALTPAPPGEAASPWVGRIEVHRVPHARPFAAARFVHAAARAIAAEAASGTLHLIHAHGWVPAGLAARFANRHARPLIVTIHHEDLALARRVPGGRLALRAVLRRADSVTAAAGYIGDAVARLMDRPRDGIPLTPLPLLGIEPATPAIGVPHGVVYAGPLTRAQGVHVLLDALSLLKKDGLPLDLVVVGDGPERVALKAQALALGVPVLFAGHVPASAVPDRIAGRRVLVVPALEEGRATIVAEALGQGVPVVATRLGEAPDLLTEEFAGALVAPGEPAALAAAVRNVVNDDAYLTGAVNAGRVLLVRRSPASEAAAFEQVYQDVRGRRSAAHGTRTSGSQPRSSQPGRAPGMPRIL